MLLVKDRDGDASADLVEFELGKVLFISYQVLVCCLIAIVLV